MDPSTKDILTLALAAIGAGLGVYNTWTGHTQRQLRLRVVPKFASGRAIGGEAFAIEVVNLSAFAVTVEHVGFTLKGTKDRAVAAPLTVDGKPWPRRLETREAVTVICRPLESMTAEPRIKAAYAQLSSGEVRTGKGPALTRLQAMLHHLEAEHP